jgi:succinoglycan biosynthesis transport protein ExoP
VTTQRPMPNGNRTLRDYVRMLRRHKWVILQAVVLVPVAAVLLSLRQPAAYEASAEVLLSRQNLAAVLTGTPDPALSQQADRIAETQAKLARVPTVAARSIDAVGAKGLTVQALLDDSEVAPERNADLLEFTVRNESPELAVRLASEYATQFTRYRLELDTAALVLARTEVEKQIAELELEGDRGSDLYLSLVDKAQQLRTMEALQTQNSFVVRPADRAEQVQPKPVRNGLLGVGLGLLIGVMFAFIWEALDTRVRSAEEVGDALHLPLLARLPEPAKRLRAKNRLVMLSDPSGVQAEAFRMLRTNLEFVNVDRDARVVMVTSATQAEGKSTTVANLAVAFARAGRRVALVDLDLRRPFVDRFFGLEGRPGVTDVALGRADLDEALVPIEITRPSPDQVNGDRRVVTGELEVLPCGPLPPDAGEFVGTRALGAIVHNLRDRFDLVLVDAPPILKVGDALALSARVDGLIVVTRLKIVRRGMLSELSRVLAAAPTAKLGFAVTDAATEDGYGYGYGYGYGHNGREPLAGEPIHAGAAGDG